MQHALLHKFQLKWPCFLFKKKGSKSRFPLNIVRNLNRNVAFTEHNVYARQENLYKK